MSAPADAEAARCIDELIAALDELPEPVRAPDKPFLMAIEGVYTIEGRGTVVTGKIEQGTIRPGDNVEILGLSSTLKSVVTSVEAFNRTQSAGAAGQNVGLLLRGVKNTDVERGQVVATPRSITPHTQFRGEVYVLSKGEGGRHTPFFDGYEPQFFFRTTDVTGRASLIGDTEMAMPGDNVTVLVELGKPETQKNNNHNTNHKENKTVGSGVVTESVG